MNRILKLLPLVIVTIATIGCSHNYYNVPQDAYAKKVRVLGIAPLLVDTESDIRHPEKEALVSLIRETNRKNEKELVAMLKNTGAYFSVRLLPDDSDQLLHSLVFRRERREDAGVVYNKYFFKLQELRDLITRNGVDAVMVVVVSGLAKKDTVRSSNLLSYLDSTYNYLIMTAQILDADGTVLWEYPNFRMRLISFPPMLALQYPAFDEAEANAGDQVEVKFKTIAGIGRALGKTQASTLQPKTAASVLYADQFDKMVSLLTPDSNLFGSSKDQEKKPSAPQPPESAPQAVPATTQPQPLPAQPAAPTPPPVTAPPAAEPVISAPAPLTVETPAPAIPHSDR